MILGFMWGVIYLLAGILLLPYLDRMCDYKLTLFIRQRTPVGILMVVGWPAPALVALWICFKKERQRRAAEF